MNEFEVYDPDRWQMIKVAMDVLRKEMTCVLVHWDEYMQVNEPERQHHVYKVMKHLDSVNRGVFVIGDEVLKGYADNQTQALLVKEKLEMELGKPLVMTVGKDGTAIFNVEKMPNDIGELEEG